ncbi:MAG: ABC transporter substrate-binding protein [bacterium]
MLQRKIISGLALLLLASLTFTGCQPAGPAAKPNSVVIAQGVDATTLDPHRHNETTSANITRQIFDGLLRRGADLRLEPELALSVEPLDTLTWEVKLRPGVTFHNGEPFDAASVKFSIERILDPATGSPQISGLSFIKHVKIIDSHTIHIITVEPYPLLRERLILPMVPPAYLTEHGDAYFAANPVGTGPYKFVSWTKDESVVLAANPDYWRGVPAVTQVTFRPIPENTARAAELVTGAVDLIANLPPHLAQSLANDPDVRVTATPGCRLIFIQFVTDRGGPLADPRVRQALNYAVDVQTIVDTILGGYGQPSTQPLTPQDFGYNPDLTGYPYDPAKARELLTAAGYPDGFAFPLDIPVGRYVMDKEVAAAVAGYLSAVNIQVDLNINDWGIHTQKILERKMEGGYLIGWGGELFDADATLYPNFRSGEPICFYRNDAVDRLLDRARATLDRPARERIYHQATALLADDAPLLLLYQQHDLYGFNPRLRWQPRPDEVISVFDMKLDE